MPNVRCRIFVNLEGTERIYTKGAGPMCPRDGFVVFRNSELLCGRLGKQTLGGGNKASLFQARTASLPEPQRPCLGLASCGEVKVFLSPRRSLLCAAAAGAPLLWGLRVGSQSLACAILASSNDTAHLLPSHSRHA